MRSPGLWEFGRGSFLWDGVVIKARANRRRLAEPNANSALRSPSDLAFPLDDFRSDEKRKLVGYADWAFHFEGSAGFRHIANDAIDRTG